MANSDIIQFLLDGRTYHTFQLPENIHASPLYPILITSVSYLLKDHFLLHEIAAARFINIVSTISSLTLLYLLASKLSNKVLAIGVVILAMIHPWTFMMAVGDYSETLFTFITLLSLYFYENKKNISTAFLLSGISFLVRNEGLLLFIAMFLVQISNSNFDLNLVLKKVRRIVRIPGFVIGCITILGWIFVLVANNLYSSKNITQYSENLRYGYYFFYEIVERKNEIPELRFISNFVKYPIGFTNNEKTSLSDPFLWIGILTLVLLLRVSLTTTRPAIRVISIYMPMYIFLHIWFPSFIHRYFFPLLFITYILVCRLYLVIFNCLYSSRQKKIFTGILFILYALVINNQIKEFSKEVIYHKYYYEGNNKVVNWIKNEIMTNENSTYTLFIEESYSKYFFTGIDSTSTKRTSDWKPGLFRDSYGHTHRTYFNQVQNTLIRFIDINDVKRANCFTIDCLKAQYELDSGKTFFVHTKIDDDKSLLFYEEHLDEIGGEPDPNSPDADDRFFILKE